MTHHASLTHFTPSGPDMIRAAMDTCPRLEDLDDILRRFGWLGFSLLRMDWGHFDEARVESQRARDTAAFFPVSFTSSEVFARLMAKAI